MEDQERNPMPTAKRLSAEQFEALLRDVRDGAQMTLSEWALEAVTEGEEHDAKLDDARAVWHAAEFALAMVKSGYLPKREALADARVLLARLEED